MLNSLYWLKGSVHKLSILCVQFLNIAIVDRIIFVCEKVSSVKILNLVIHAICKKVTIMVYFKLFKIADSYNF